MTRPRLALALAGALLTLAPPRPATAAEPSPGTYADVEGGRLFYETCGSGPRTLVLLHDGVLHAATWDAVWPALCKRFRVVRYDRRGFGRSAAATTPYAPTDDLGAVMKAAGVGRAVLVGSSAGSGIAVDYALKQPDAVKRLVLVGPFVSGFPLSQHFIDRGTAIGQALARGDAMTAINDRWILAPGHDEARRRLLGLLMANPQDVTHADRQRPAPPAMPRLSGLRKPVLLIVGEDDIPDVQAQAGALEALVPGARRVVVKDAGHLVSLEQPERLSDLISAFAEGKGP